MTDKKIEDFFLSCFNLWELCSFLLWLVISDFKLLCKFFSNWWSGCAWRWSDVVERNWRGRTAWLSSLAESWRVAERSKVSAALDTRLSMEREEKSGSGGTARFLEKLERSKVSLITVGDCACNETWDKPWRELQRVACCEPRMLVLELEQKILGWEFRGRKLHKMGLERLFGVGAWWNLVWQGLRTVTMLVNSEVRFLCRFAFRYPGETWFTPWKL